jgi:hypothetical protein
MDVTDRHLACTLPADGEPGCGCAPVAKKGSPVAKAAIVAAGTAAACTACCVLPFTLPAVILANFGGLIAVLDHAHGWITWLAIAAVGGAWIWIWRQSSRAQRRPAISTLVMMVIASLVISLAASWPLIKPAVFYTLGIAKKAPDRG